MDESLWELFWTTGLPEAYALAKQAGGHVAEYGLLQSAPGGAASSLSEGAFRAAPPNAVPEKSPL